MAEDVREAVEMYNEAGMMEDAYKVRGVAHSRSHTHHSPADCSYLYEQRRISYSVWSTCQTTSRGWQTQRS